MGRLDVRVLGPLEVADEDGIVALPQGKARATLGALLIQPNTVVSSDRLIDAVWGAHPPATAHKSIHVYISQLRRRLGPDTIVTRPTGYELRLEPSQLDLSRFERLRQEAAGADPATTAATLREALALWRGPAFADFGYDAFAHSTIARLEELRLVSLEDRIEADLSLGRHGELVAELATLAREHPLRERIRALQMLALYRCGRQADALAVYQLARRALVDDLGIEPGRSLRDLERDILAHAPSLEAAPRQTTFRTHAPDTHDPTIHARSWRLVGRARELTELVAGLEQAVEGRGGLFLIAGEPGIGKSSLMDELARRAAERVVRVLSGRCWEAGGAPAYWPWCQSIRAYVRSSDPELLAAELGTGAPEVAELVPEVRELLPDVPLPARSRDPDTARFQLLDATATFLRRTAARQPLVLLLDDLHAADTPSLILLQFLARELAAAHMLVVCGYRVTELGRGDSPLAVALAELRREPVTRVLSLAPLARDDVASLIRLTAGVDPPESLISAIDAQTEGNPLFLREVVRLLEQEGRLSAPGEIGSSQLRIPQGVREAIGRRLGHLSDACRDVLIVASILGREFRLDALQEATARAGHELLTLLDSALAAGLVVEVPGTRGRLRFSHALVRDTLQEALATSRRVGLHRTIGEALERLYAGDRDPHLAELAFHFFEALPIGDAEPAIDYARRAARRAAHLLAYEEAARLFRMAIAALDSTSDAIESRRCELLLELGDAESRAGNMPEGRSAFLEAAGIAGRRDLPEALGHAALGYGGRTIWARAGHDPRVISLLRSALAALPESDSPLRVRLLARLAGALRDEFSPQPRDELSKHAVEMARRLGDPATLAYALDGRYAAILRPDNPEERLAIANEVVVLADAVADRERSIQGRHCRLIAMLEIEDLERADAEVAAMGALAEELRQPVQLAYMASTAASLALFRGRFDDAERLIARAQEMGRVALSRDTALSCLLQLYLLRGAQGRVAEVEEPLRLALPEYPTRVVLRCVHTLVLCDLARLDEASAALDRLAIDDFSAIPFDNEWLLCMSLLADASERLGSAQHARTLYDILGPYAGRNASNADEMNLGAVARSLGNAAHALARWDDATRHFEAALEENTRMGAPPWVEQTRRDFARMRRARDGQGARGA